MEVEESSEENTQEANTGILPVKRKKGRKASQASIYFTKSPDSAQSGKLGKVECMFCSKQLVKQGPRMEKHLLKCFSCPDDIKSSLFPKLKDVIPSKQGKTNLNKINTNEMLSEDLPNIIIVGSDYNKMLNDETSVIVAADSSPSALICNDGTNIYSEEKIHQLHSARQPHKKKKGRKASYAFAYFKESPLTGQTGKLRRVQCVFCSHELVQQGPRMEKHILRCRRCPEILKSCFSGKSVGVNSSKSNSKSRFSDKIAPQEQKTLTSLLAKIIYTCGLPLSFTENKQIQKFFHRLRPSFTLPSKKELSQKLLDAEYHKMHKEMERTIANADTLAIVCHGWTNVRNEVVINVFVTTPKPVLFRTFFTEGRRQTAEDVAELLETCIRDIGPQKVMAIVTDNASGMASTWKILEEKHPDQKLITYGCAALGLNLIFTDIIDTIPTFSDLIKMASTLIDNIKNSRFLTEILQKEGTTEVLRLPVKTRWASCVACLESLQNNKVQIKGAFNTGLGAEILTEDKQDIVAQIISNDEFWERVEEFIRLLKPIAEAIKIIERDSPSISCMVEIFNNIEQETQQNIPPCLELTKENIIFSEIISSRKDFILQEVHYLASLLDLRFRSTHLTSLEMVKATEFLYQISETMPGFEKDVLMMELGSFISCTEFFKQKFLWIVCKKMHPSDWWATYCKDSQLSKIAVRILDLPLTTAMCEKPFSSFNTTMSQKKNRLNADRSGKLVFLHVNNRLLKKEMDVELDHENEVPFEVEMHNEDEEQVEEDEEEVIFLSDRGIYSNDIPGSIQFKKLPSRGDDTIVLQWEDNSTQAEEDQWIEEHLED